jgi:hypothetical protein
MGDYKDYRVLHFNSIGIKPVKYISDGRGRDYYISYNNGGMDKQAYIPQGSTNKETIYKRYYHVGKDPSPVKYHRDGSGRDSYINLENGGIKDHKSLAQFHLKDILRPFKTNYESTNGLKFINRTRLASQEEKVLPTYITKREIKDSMDKAEVEKRSVTRLYEEEAKIKTMKLNENRKKRKNLSCHIFPHLRNEEYNDNSFTEDVKIKLDKYKDYEMKKKKLKQIIHNCHNLEFVLP